MATFNRFEDIEGWQLGRELTKEVYAVTRRGAFARDFSLVDQIRRACISVTSNIAEGFERDSNPEFVRFLSYAKGSAGEVRSQLYCALDQGYLTEAEFRQLYDLSSRTSRKIGALKHYLSRHPAGPDTP